MIPRPHALAALAVALTAGTAHAGDPTVPSPLPVPAPARNAPDAAVKRPDAPSKAAEDPAPGTPTAAAAAAWATFADERNGRCVGAAGKIDPPLAIEAEGHQYRLEGHRLIQLDQDQDDELRIGVVSATKDDREETLEAIRTLVKRFKLARMDVLIVNGDIGADEFQLEAIFKVLAEQKLLVIVHTGNTESCGSFNRAAETTRKQYPNFLNGNWVRRLELDDGTLLTLPGYYDRRFAHTGGAARYSQDDLEALRRMGEGAPKPWVLVSHGPPKMSGKRAIDVATDVGNVGDPDMTTLIKEVGIPFGIFGHILEAGGRATDLTGQAPRSPNAWHKTLYLNAGTANPDPWSMLDGTTGWGMGAFVEIKGERARFHFERLQKKADLQ